MAALALWLKSFFGSYLIHLYNAGIDLLQSISDALADFVLSIIGLLPQGSGLPSMVITPTGSTFSLFLQCLNWVAPISYMVQLVSWSVAGMLLYIAIAPIARWVKALN